MPRALLSSVLRIPILVDTNAGILAGHGRLLAARKLGLAEVPVIVLDHLSETQKRAYIIADNKLAMNAGWDDDLLAAELAQLEREGFDLELIGFSDREMEMSCSRRNQSQRQSRRLTMRPSFRRSGEPSAASYG